MAQDNEKTAFFSRRVVSLRSIGSTVLPEIKLQELDFHTLGRARENTIVLENDTVSRRHAELCCMNGRFVIRDLGSGNGVVISGRRVREQELVDGDQIELGECVIEFRDSDTSREKTAGHSASESCLATQCPQPPTPTPVAVPRATVVPVPTPMPPVKPKLKPKSAQRSGTADFQVSNISRTPMYIGLAGGGIVLVVLLLVLVFSGRGRQEATHQTSPSVTAPVRPPAGPASAPRSSEEIEQRLAKASAQYQAGKLGQALEEYRHAIEAGATDQDVRRTYEQIAKEFEQRLQAQLTRADDYERRQLFQGAISELQGALTLFGETSDARLAEIQARVGRLQQRL